MDFSLQDGFVCLQLLKTFRKHRKLTFPQHTDYDLRDSSRKLNLPKPRTDIDLQDRNRRSALHLAKDVECVCFILSYHGEPSIETMFGKTVLITATENQQWDICRVLYGAQAALSLWGVARESSLLCSHVAIMPNAKLCPHFHFWFVMH